MIDFRLTTIHIFVVFVLMITCPLTSDGATKLLADDPAFGDFGGNSVSISGDWAIFGAYYDDDNGSFSGSAYIFHREGSSWSQQAKLTASDGAENDLFGKAVSIDGNHAIIGAPWDVENGIQPGSAYIFKLENNIWVQQAKLMAPDGGMHDEFGVSVSISKNFVIIGAPGHGENGVGDAGAAYIYKTDGVDWVLDQKILAEEHFTFNDEFGNSVSISDDHAIVGAKEFGSLSQPNGSNSGASYIFYRTISGFWQQQDFLTASDGAEYDYFGQAVSINDGYAIVGAFGDDDLGISSGSAYIFKQQGADWIEQSKLLANDGKIGDAFGESVSISNGYAIVGAKSNDGVGDDSGAAYVFKREGDTWINELKLTASDGQPGDRFGEAVDISLGYAIIGAPLYDYDKDVINNSGVAYIYDIGIAGDVNCDEYVNLLDACIAVKIITGMADGECCSKDHLGNDGKIGLIDALYIMQKTAEYRE